LRLATAGSTIIAKSTERIIIFGHQRWDIENYAFQQLALEWHSDHVFCP
jgi:hypothetical protein